MYLFRPRWTKGKDSGRSKHWWVEFGFEGRRHRLNTKRTSKRDAFVVAASIIRSVERGTEKLDAIRSVTPDTLVHEFLGELARRNVSQDYVKLMRTRLRWVLRGVEHLDELTPDVIRGRLTELSRTRLRRPEERGPGRLPTPRTLNGYRAAIHALFAWLVKESRWPNNPVDAVPNARTFGPARTRRALDVAELERLLETAPPARSLLYRVAATTGLRRSELASLCWSDVDLDAGIVVVRAKSAKNRREAVLPLPAHTVKALRTARRNASASEAVFRTIPNIKSVYHDLKVAEIDAEGGDKVDFHSLRVTYATSLARTGAPLALTQRLMRHSTPILTANVYTRLNLKDAALGRRGR